MTHLEAFQVVGLDVLWFARWPMLALLWMGIGKELREFELPMLLTGIAILFTLFVANWSPS